MIRRVLAASALLAAGLALASCGFRPLYGESTAGAAQQLAQIRIAPIEHRIGQKLHNMLLDRLNPEGAPARPQYLLTVRLTESIQHLALRRDESATRANLLVIANFSLEPYDTRDRRRFAASASSVNSYNRLRSDYATLSAESDARDRALRTLAEEIRIRVAAALENPDAFMVRRAAEPAQPPPQSQPLPAPLRF